MAISIRWRWTLDQFATLRSLHNYEWLDQHHSKAVELHEVPPWLQAENRQVR